MPAQLKHYQQLGIDHCYFELDDQAKSGLLRQLRDGGSRVAYVSDGVSQVAASDVVTVLQKHGMQHLASGTDLVLLDHSLLSLVHAVNIAKRVAHIMRQNQLLYAGLNGVQLVLTSTRIVPPLLVPLLINGSLLLRIHDAQRLRLWRDVLSLWSEESDVKEMLEDGSN